MNKIIIFDFYKTLFSPETQELYIGVDELIQKLSGDYSLILVSTGDKERLNVINQFKTFSVFQEIFICRKKSKKLFRSIQKKYCASSINIIVVGDRENEEIMIGNQLGYTTCLVKPKSMFPTKLLLKNIEYE